MEQRYKPRHRAAYCKRNLRRRGRAAPATDTRAYAPAALRVQIPVGAPNKYPRPKFWVGGICGAPHAT